MVHAEGRHGRHLESTSASGDCMGHPYLVAYRHKGHLKVAGPSLVPPCRFAGEQTVGHRDNVACEQVGDPGRCTTAEQVAHMRAVHDVP